MAYWTRSGHQAPYEEAPEVLREEPWQGEEESYQANDEPLHGGPDSERAGHRKRRHRQHQRRHRQHYDNEQPEQPEQQPEQQPKQQYTYGHQFPPQLYNPLPQYPSPQPYGWSIPQQQPYTQHAVPLPLHPPNFISASMQYSESSQYAGYGPAPSPYAPAPYAPAPYPSSPYAPASYAPAPYAPAPYAPSPYAPSPTPYAQCPPIIQYPSSYASAPASYVPPINPASTQPSNASQAYRGRPQGVRKSKKGPPQVPNPPGAKKRRKRLEAINSRLAKGKSKLDNLEKQVSALRTWYEGLEGVEASMKEEEGAEHDGGKVKAEEMEDEEIDFGDEEEEEDDGGVRLEGEWDEVDKNYGGQQEGAITQRPIKREL